MGLNILGADQVTILVVDATSKAARATPYDTAGNPMSDVSSLNNVLNALNAAVTITLGGQSTVGFDVEATSGTITLTFEVTINGTVWEAISAAPVGGGAAVSSTTGNGQWLASIGGYLAVRARVSAITGAASMSVSVVVTPGTSALAASAAPAATVTANQGVPAALANAWPTEITDGTHGPAAVKAASTAAVATDTALVVAVSPNNSVAITAAALPLPAGAATAANQTTIGTQTTELNDGTRSATIKAASTAAVAGDTSLVVALSPNSPVPAGTNAIGTVTAAQATAANLNATAAQGAPGTLANAWPTEITDGTHGPAAVKAASTLAVAADPALVVSLNPASAAPKATTTTVAQVASSATVVTLLAANANRLGAVITNASTQILFLKLGATASLTSYTVQVPITNGNFEVPFGYTGIITGLWTSANGFAYVTELTP